MMSGQRYAQTKARGICVDCGRRPADPLVVLCAQCREVARQCKAAWAHEHRAQVRAATARYWEAKYLAPGPNLLACCGRWHKLDTVPCTVPCCGTTYLEARPMTRKDEVSHARSHAVILDPLRTVSESNMREHWAAKAKRAKLQRSATYYWLRSLLPSGPSWALPLTITLTRIAPRCLDSGNFEPSMKAIQDACADYLAGAYGTGQDRQPGLTWRYAQRRGGVKQYGVEVLLEEGKP